MNSQITDSNTRAAFEADFRERYSIPDNTPLNRCGGVECEWRGFQAAWTRKPAEQVAGVEPAAYVKYDVGVQPTFYPVIAGRVCGLADCDDIEKLSALYAHPAPEPVSIEPRHPQFVAGFKEGHVAGRKRGKAPEPVSVPVKWEDRLRVMKEDYPDVVNAFVEVAIKTAKNSEIAEWRALAAERGWVK